MSRARLDADDAASLLRELAWLRKRGGFTAARLVQAPIVDEVLRGSLEDTFERLRHRFVSAIHSLSESGGERDEPLVGVLLAAFALSPETAGSGSLLERRRAMASRRCWMCRRCTVGLSMRRPRRSSWWSSVSGAARWSTTGWPTWLASWTSSRSRAPTPLMSRHSQVGSSALTAVLSKGLGGMTTSGTSIQPAVGARRCMTRRATTSPSGQSRCRARSRPRRSPWPVGPSTPGRYRPPSRCASLGRCRPASGSSPGLAPLPAPRQPASTTAPTWTRTARPPSPSATSTVGCLVGLGGSGEGCCAQKWASLLEGCANCRSVNSGNRQW